MDLYADDIRERLFVEVYNAKKLEELPKNVLYECREDLAIVYLSKNASGSLFDVDGSLLAKAAAVIGALTIANRVTSYKTIKKPSLLERIFRPLFQPRLKTHYVPVRTHRKPVQRKPEHRQPVYKNTIERHYKPVTGHGGGPNGRMKGPNKPGKF